MIANTVVRSRIGPKIKDEAADIVAVSGLTVSDAFRMMLMRTVAEKQVPFDAFVPKAETIEAMQAARRGDTKKVTTPEGLIADSHVNNRTHGSFQMRLQATSQRPSSQESRYRPVDRHQGAGRGRAPAGRLSRSLAHWRLAGSSRLPYQELDLLLIYRKPDPDTLQLVRLGSRSELSL